MKDTLNFLVQALLNQLKINVDHEELSFQIKSHPSYPSLHAITGVLTHFKIENLAIKVPVNKETLAQLPKCFIAQIKNSGGEHLVLVIKKGIEYKIIYSSKEKQQISIQTFLEEFTGILVAVEKDENFKPFKTKNSNIVKWFSYVSLALFILLFLLLDTTTLAVTHFILSILGVAISLLIIHFDLGIESKIVNSICSQESKTTNCNSVLNSKGALLFNSIKLSNLSFIYFTAISVSWFLISLNKSTYEPILYMSLLAVPLVFYSLYYQIIISKTWCLLCLGIASILTLQALLLFFVPISFTNLSVSFFSIAIVLFSFISISVLWLYIVAKIKTEHEFNTVKIESTKFKRNFEIFRTLLKKSETLYTNIPNSSEVIFGNKTAILHITIITNPFCGHCKSVHTLVENILKSHQEKVSITIRFNIDLSDTKSDLAKIVCRLLEIYQTEGQLKCLKAMHDIYDNNNANTWLNKYNTCKNAEPYLNTIQMENEWCKTYNINFTPEILIQGRSYPKAYERSDLLYFIEELFEYYVEKPQKK